jgi:hypothetical protein
MAYIRRRGEIVDALAPASPVGVSPTPRRLPLFASRCPGFDPQSLGEWVRGPGRRAAAPRRLQSRERLLLVDVMALVDAGRYERYLWRWETPARWRGDAPLRFYSVTEQVYAADNRLERLLSPLFDLHGFHLHHLDTLGLQALVGQVFVCEVEWGGHELPAIPSPELKGLAPPRLARSYGDYVSRVLAPHQPADLLQRFVSRLEPWRQQGRQTVRTFTREGVTADQDAVEVKVLQRPPISPN